MKNIKPPKGFLKQQEALLNFNEARKRNRTIKRKLKAVPIKEEYVFVIYDLESFTLFKTFINYINTNFILKDIHRIIEKCNNLELSYFLPRLGTDKEKYKYRTSFFLSTEEMFMKNDICIYCTIQNFTFNLVEIRFDSSPIDASYMTLSTIRPPFYERVQAYEFDKQIGIILLKLIEDEYIKNKKIKQKRTFY